MVIIFLFVMCAFLPELAMADVHISLKNFGDELTHRLLPLVAIMGLAWSAFSFVTGNPNAKSHVFMAIVGCAIGFGAKSIVSLIQQLVS